MMHSRYSDIEQETYPGMLQDLYDLAQEWIKRFAGKREMPHSLEEVLQMLDEEDESCESRESSENQNVSVHMHDSRVLMDNKVNQLVDDQSKAVLVQEKDENDIPKTLVEEKKMEKMDGKILANCQTLPKEKMEKVQADIGEKSSFEAGNDDKSSLLSEIEDEMEKTSTDEQEKWEMEKMKPERTKDGEESKILYEIVDSNGQFVCEEGIKCKMKQEAVEETDIKHESNCLMKEKKNPAVNKAEKHWKKFKKKSDKEFRRFKQAWKKKQQNLMLKLKKNNQQMLMFNKKLKENQDGWIKAAETWKLGKSWTKMVNDLKAENEALKLESNVKNVSWKAEKLDESKPDFAARKPKMKQQKWFNEKMVEKLDGKKCSFAMIFKRIGKEVGNTTWSRTTIKNTEANHPSHLAGGEGPRHARRSTRTPQEKWSGEDGWKKLKWAWRIGWKKWKWSWKDWMEEANGSEDTTRAPDKTNTKQDAPDSEMAGRECRRMRRVSCSQHETQ